MPALIHAPLHGPVVGRAPGALVRHRVPPDATERAILAALTIGACRRAGGSARVAAGCHDDIARDGRRFGHR